MRRIANPSVPQTAALVALAVVGTLWAVKAATKKKWKKTQAKKRLSCHPYKYDEVAVREAVEERLPLGDPSLIAAEVASELFGNYPGGGTVTFPPAPEDPQPAQCVWALVVDAVDVAFKKHSIEPEKSTGVIGWKVRDKNDPGYPWLDPSLELNNVPTPGMFVDFNNTEATWNPAEGYESLIRMALASALRMAGGDPTLAAGSSTTSKRLRREMRYLFHCSEWDDQLFGQENTDKASGPGEVTQSWMLNKQGRGLDWTPSHADNLSRIAEGQAPLRQVALDGSPLSDDTFAMLLWIPAVDLDALKGAVPTIKALKWPDGSSTTEPPPGVQNLGVDLNGVELPEGEIC